jgi:hypothetical protein|tara:strand:- start:170 stop:385 length:216 start_codon:yes stop_codon:yes gene_type:complete
MRNTLALLGAELTIVTVSCIRWIVRAATTVSRATLAFEADIAQLAVTFITAARFTLAGRWVAVLVEVAVDG